MDTIGGGFGACVERGGYDPVAINMQHLGENAAPETAKPLHSAATCPGSHYPPERRRALTASRMGLGFDQE